MSSASKDPHSQAAGGPFTAKSLAILVGGFGVAALCFYLPQTQGFHYPSFYRAPVSVVSHRLKTGAPAEPVPEPITLYSLTPSYASARVKLYLEERGIRYNEVPVDVKNKPKELFEVNPRGQMPAVKVGNVNLAESMAILNFADANVEGKPLVPLQTEARAAMAQKMFEFVSRIEKTAFYGDVFFGNASADDVKPRMRERFKEYKQWDKDLQGKEFLAGPYSTADVAAFHAIYLDKEMGFDFKSQTPNLAAWIDRMYARPNVKKVTDDYMNAAKKYVGAKWVPVWTSFDYKE